jgi:hypothetical protein
MNEIMKQYIIVTALLVFTLQTKAQAQAEQQVLDLSKKKFHWLTGMQLDSLESMLDDRLLFIHSSGWTETKTELIQDLKSGKLRYVRVDVEETSVRMYEKTAIVTGKGKFFVVLEGKDLEINLSYTEVYVQRGNKWVLASRHANRMV